MTLGEEHHAARVDAQLAGARAEQIPLDADVIAEIEQLEDLEIQLRQRVLADVDLDALQSVGEREEIGLAEVPDGQDTARGDRLDLVGLEGFGGAIAKARRQGRNGVRAVEPPRVDVHAQRLQRQQVGPSLLYLVVE